MSKKYVVNLYNSKLTNSRFILANLRITKFILSYIKYYSISGTLRICNQYTGSYKLENFRVDYLELEELSDVLIKEFIYSMSKDEILYSIPIIVSYDFCPKNCIVFGNTVGINRCSEFFIEHNIVESSKEIIKASKIDFKYPELLDLQQTGQNFIEYE